jgi:3-phenylpropionate/cinnamic acid dioxygenase small subunit
MSTTRSDIENTLYQYAWTYDMNELDGMGGCFTTDAEVEFRDSGWKIGREAVTAEMRRRREKYSDGRIPWHVISNVYITDETENQATVRSWYTFFIRELDGTQKFSSIGWYDDVFAREDGLWRIQRRHVRSPHER